MKRSIGSLCRYAAMSVIVCTSAALAAIVLMNGQTSISGATDIPAEVGRFISLGSPRWVAIDRIWKAAARPLAGSADHPAAATAALRFAEFLGVNVHMAYYWTTYNNVALVKSALEYLGIDHVRDKLLDWPNVQKNYQDLAAVGVSFDFVLPAVSGHPNTTNLPEFISMVRAFVQDHPGSVTAIEGPNEVNIWPILYSGGTTLADQAALQRALHAAVRQNSALKSIPIYNLTLAYTDAAQFAQLGNLSQAADYANSHAYLNSAQTPRYSLGVILPFAKQDAPGLPLVITETGYETNSANSYSGLDRAGQAKLTLDELMDAFTSGVTRIYLYELLDEGGEKFGLFSADGTPKPAATAIHNLAEILRDRGLDPSNSPGSLNYAVPDLPANGNQLLLEKSDGTFDLILWAESAIWNPADKAEITAPVATSTVKFAQRHKTVLIFDPLRGTAPIASYHDVQSVRVTLSDHPIVVEIRYNAASRHIPQRAPS